MIEISDAHNFILVSKNEKKSFQQSYIDTLWNQISFKIPTNTSFTSHHSTIQPLKHKTTTFQIYQIGNKDNHQTNSQPIIIFNWVIYTLVIFQMCQSLILTYLHTCLFTTSLTITLKQT